MLDTASIALSVYDVAVGAATWRSVLADVARATRADEAALFSAEPGARVLSRFEHGCLDPSVHERYVRDFAALDTQMTRAFDADDGIAISGKDLITEDEFRRCPVHNEYIVPNDIGAQVVWFFRTADGCGHTFALLRSERAGRFGVRARRLGERLLPHLRRALELAAMQAPAARTADAARALIVDARGTVLWASAGAAALLRDGVVPTAHGALLPPTRGAAAYLATLRGERRDAGVAWPDVVADVHAMAPATADRLGVSMQRGASLVLLRPRPAHRALSPRERECLLCIARGDRTARIAAHLGLTERTVNQYLDSAVRKLGARTRAQAAVEATLSGAIQP